MKGRRRARTVLDVVGLLALAVAAWMAHPAVGVGVLGAGALALAWLLDDDG